MMFDKEHAAIKLLQGAKHIYLPRQIAARTIVGAWDPPPGSSDVTPTRSAYPVGWVDHNNIAGCRSAVQETRRAGVALSASLIALASPEVK